MQKKTHPYLWGKVKKLFRSVALYGCMFSVLMFAGCADEGGAIDESRKITFQFLAVTVDSMQLGVKINNEIRTTDFFAPSSGKLINDDFFLFNSTKKLTVYNVDDNRVLIDTTLVIGRKSSVYTSFYQRSQGDALQYVFPHANEPFPPNGYGKISILYTHLQLPDSVNVVVENSLSGLRGDDYVPTDTIRLIKGDFSRFFLGRNSHRYPLLKIYTADNTWRQIGNTGFASNMNADFTMYCLRTDLGVSNGVYSLVNEKMY